MNVVPFNDGELLRQQRNLTNSQRKNIKTTREGVLVNNLIKDKEVNLNDTKDSYLISDEIALPSELYNDNKIVDRKLVPLSAIALGVMSAVAIVTGFARKSAKIARNLPTEKWLPPVTRNVQLSKEMHQLVYQYIQNPNKKTLLAGLGVLTLSTMAFMGKTFFDGYKDIWVKRKEADIQKNLQEKLVAVETQSFSGKIQIIRSMLSKYAADFEKYISPEGEKILPNFGKNKYSILSFTSEKRNEDKKKSNFGNILLGALTFGGIVGLGFLSMKNLSKGKSYLLEAAENSKNTIMEFIKKTNTSSKGMDKDLLEHMFMAIDDGSAGIRSFIKEQINTIKWNNPEEKTEYLNGILAKLKTSTTKANPNYAGDGTPRPAFNSFVEDYRAFFYNWLLDTSNPQFQQLFFGITGLTAASYGGKLAGDAIKEVQVKKINAETELELQKRLVSTELRNFKSKKDSAILPLVEEFYKQVDSGTRSKEELKAMAENVLFEIKNGPPFVYS